MALTSYLTFANYTGTGAETAHTLPANCYRVVVHPVGGSLTIRTVATSGATMTVETGVHRIIDNENLGSGTLYFTFGLGLTVELEYHLKRVG